ncbi:acetolactate decarboxylase [Candidatus Margulisiibacteriota bacterium]
MGKQFFSIKLLIAFSILFSGCVLQNNNTLTQVSTIDALISGLYDGQMPCKKLLTYGNFGIGTFDKLDGEMVVLNHKVYQIKASGKVYSPKLSLKTPFASVCKFKPEKKITVKEKNYLRFKAMLDKALPNQNLFYGLKMKGSFRHIETRSVPAQQKPYPPLSEITKNQPQFSFKNITGTIIGFRLPPYVKGINVPGYHLHFISDDFTSGGHVLRFELEKGICEIDELHKFFMVLPKGNLEFSKIDLSKDRQKELTKVEQ